MTIRNDMADSKARRLSEVINYIKELIDSQLANKKFWLKAEISNVNFHNSGHCYIDFVENENGKTIAQCRATIWASSIQAIRSELGSDFNNIIKKGGEILCNVEVNFSATFGLSLNIWTIDKYFALGELERRKQETLKRLTTEQLLEKNKVHTLPIVIQKIAIVGSPGTSGHTDFLKQLERNEYRYKFIMQNFPCQVQGEKAELEIIQRLNELSNSAYDVIVLIRGGGSKLDLEVFNSYELAKIIALHKKPILTGIGHETDISIADLVANLYFKTPSALGAYIVSRNHNYENSIANTYSKISAFYDSYLQRQIHRIKQYSTQFKTVSVSYTQLRRGQLHKTGNRISAIIKDKLGKENQFLNVGKQVIKNATHLSIHNRRNWLAEVVTLISLRSKQAISTKDSKIKHSKELAEHYIKGRLLKEQNFLINCEQFVKLYHPDNVLERGYSITRHYGKIIGKTVKIVEGDKIEIETIDKVLTASVISIKQKVSKWKTLLTKVLQRN